MHPDIGLLADIMARLRDPERGCPWDVQQNARSLAPYVLEEVYEVVDAIERDESAQLCEELGDLLFQVVFHARIAEEAGLFDLQQVIDGIAAKLQLRHPHVFAATSAQQPAIEALHTAWEQTKQRERAVKGIHGVLGDIPLALPAVQRAQKIQGRLARAGFDWSCATEVLQQLRAEIDELEQAMAAADPLACQDELGDVLFSCINVARHLRVDAETALRHSNSKVAARISWMESTLQQRGLSWSAQSMDELETLWQVAKKALASSR